MSCADDPDCVETLGHIDEFMDAEIDAERFRQLQSHLEACPPCMQQYVMMQDLRWKVASSCGCRHAPDALRQEILTRITEIRVAAVTTRTSTTVSWQSTTRFRSE